MRDTGNSFYSSTELSEPYFFLLKGRKYDYFYDFGFIFASGITQEDLMNGVI